MRYIILPSSTVEKGIKQGAISQRENKLWFAGMEVIEYKPMSEEISSVFIEEEKEDEVAAPNNNKDNIRAI